MTTDEEKEYLRAMSKLWLLKTPGYHSRIEDIREAMNWIVASSDDFPKPEQPVEAAMSLFTMFQISALLSKLDDPQAVFSAGVLWGQICVGRPRLLGEKIQARLAAQTKRRRNKKTQKQQDAIAELHRRWKKSPDLSCSAIAEAMAEEGWGKPRTLKRYFAGQKREQHVVPSR